MDPIALVAVNLYYNENQDKSIILNNKNIPLLYYWNINENENLINSLITDEKIFIFLKEKIKNLDIYSKSKISYIYYKINNNDETFVEDNVNVQDYVSIDKINGLLETCIDDIAKDIYFDIFHAEYNERNDDPIIYDIYVKANLINKEQLSVYTFLNYLRTIAYKKYNLSNENLEKLYYKASEIIDKSQKYHENV